MADITDDNNNVFQVNRENIFKRPIYGSAPAMKFNNKHLAGYFTTGTV